MELQKWNYIKEQKAEMVKAVEHENQLKHMCKFWTGVCYLRGLLKKLIENTEKRKKQIQYVKNKNRAARQIMMVGRVIL